MVSNLSIWHTIKTVCFPPANSYCSSAAVLIFLAIFVRFYIGEYFNFWLQIRNKIVACNQTQQVYFQLVSSADHLCIGMLCVVCKRKCHKGFFFITSAFCQDLDFSPMTLSVSNFWACQERKLSELPSLLISLRLSLSRSLSFPLAPPPPSLTVSQYVPQVSTIWATFCLWAAGVPASWQAADRAS